MRFKDLSDEQKKDIAEQYRNRTELGLTVEKLAINIGNQFGLSERTVRKWFNKLNLKEKDSPEPEQYQKAKEREFNKSKKRFIISWAQNNTKAHSGFLKNIEAYAKHINADIHIIAGRYKNPTSVWTSQQQDEEFWDSKIVQYLDANRHDIHKYMSIMSDVKIQPTAVNPMSGMEGMSKENSCIFGHPKVHMTTIPVLDSDSPKMMLTTGAITEINYTDSKAGKKSEFHHQLGFVIVEIENEDVFHVRQVISDDKNGSFYDLFYNVNKGVVTKINEIEGVIMGDLHYGEHDETVLAKSFELFKVLKPKNVVLHDVFDAKSISHHTMNDPFTQYGMEVRGENNLKKEVNTMLDGLSKFEHFENVIVVKSNHDVHLDKFLTNDWRKLPTAKNSLEYMEYSSMLLKQHAQGNVIGVIPEIINNRFPKYKTLTYNDSYKIKGYEISMHGEIGANGSRGSAIQFRKLNTKIITAHTHSPSRFDNVLCTGTTTKLRLSYNKGASSWLQSHVIIHKDGRAQHINFIGKNKTYTTFKK